MRPRRHDGHRALLSPADEPADPAGPADLYADGQTLARGETDARPDRAATDYDRELLPMLPHHGDVLDVTREAGQRDPREAARRCGDADAGPGQQRRHEGSRDNEAETERHQKPSTQREHFSMSYAQTEMA